ncbi:MAG TPA: hypothetical protein VGB85_01015, partial [Nannocystis sp.]
MNRPGSSWIFCIGVLLGAAGLPGCDDPEDTQWRANIDPCGCVIDAAGAVDCDAVPTDLLDECRAGGDGRCDPRDSTDPDCVPDGRCDLADRRDPDCYPDGYCDPRNHIEPDCREDLCDPTHVQPDGSCGDGVCDTADSTDPD